MFIDEVEITIKGGNGGPGAVAFFAMKAGPSGGNGGNGGDVYFVVNPNLSDLHKYLQKTLYQAGNGQKGGSNRRQGEKGADLQLQVPPGVTLVDLQTHQEVELEKNSPRMLVCRGGAGGLGNDAFKSATYQTPKKATPGEKGEERHLKIVLKLIADYGLVGLPNAGKSSLLNILTAAHVKTANYPFTTLEPNLGVFNGKVLADIPGLIEGASKGKGLGINFLKHIEKVSTILHCVAADSPDVKADYKTVVAELEKYNKKLLEKKTIILLTKIDLVSKEEQDKKTKLLKEFNADILPISIYKEESIGKLKEGFL